MPSSTPPLSDAAVRERLREFPAWSLSADGWLERDLTLKNFSRALLLVNAIGYLAEQLDHHPDLSLYDYKHLTIRLKTHAAGGITARDFALVEQIEALPQPE